jgi:ribonuclease D
MNIRLAKEHSAADWSTRPLPEPWLNYAALDVELLVELRELLLQQLIDAERKVWADEEFEYLTRWQPAVAGEDPWRRLSGIHTLRQPRQLAIARDVWLWRDEMARERDKAPGRIVPDAALVDIAKNELKSARDVYMLASLRNRSHKNFADELWSIRTRALALSDSELPVVSRKTGTLPPPKVWADKNPDAAARFEAVRPKLNTLAEELQVAPEVLVSPEPIRQFCWDPSGALENSDSLHPWLQSRNVRNWQAQLIAPILNTITL